MAPLNLLDKHAICQDNPGVDLVTDAMH